MRVMQRWLATLGLVGAALSAGAANTTVKLVLSHDSARAGETVMAGVVLRMEKGWHTYWRNGGDSGAPTEIAWTLPPGVTAGEIQWPVPERYETEGLFTYVYHDEVVLLVPLRLAANARSGAFELKAKVSWLECEKLCVAANGDVAAKFSIGAESKASKDAALLEAAKKKLPATKPDSNPRAAWQGAAKDDTRPLRIEWTADPAAKAVDFFPFASDKFQVKTTNESAKVADGKVELVRGVVQLDKTWPNEIGGLLIEKDAGGKTLGAYEATLKIGGARAAASTPATATVKKKSLPAVLGLGFLGGLILNLMPCVLPVLALKVLSFVQQSQESAARVRFLGLVYGAGVLASFLVLAGIVIAVKRATGIASWGMQFQNPQFLVGVTVLVTLMALNLFGVFEVTLSSRTLGAAGELASREGAAGAFFNGVVAVVLGTSCTAPFLGLALGYALAQEAPVIVATFAAVAVGLAFPYVLLSFVPALKRFLPRPGVWMERFKVALGFPVLATALWLLSQMSTHFGADGLLWMGLFLVTLAVAAWVFGQFVQRGTTRRGLAAAVSVFLLLVGYAVALEGELKWRSPAEPAAVGAIKKRDPNGIDWQGWNPQMVADARAAGRVVFVDFTADWCLNCQANKRTSIEIPSVRQRLKELDALPLLGDFTRKNPLIAEELKSHGRAGVPLVLVYPKDASKPPIVLPEILTPSIVLDALDQAAK